MDQPPLWVSLHFGFMIGGQACQSFERSGWIRMPERPRPPKERKFSGESVFSEKMEKFSVPLFIEGTISEKKKQARRV